MGDYVLSTAFLEIVSRSQDSRILEVVAMAGRTLSIGELMQLSLSKAHTYREQDYYDVIDCKTGTLFKASAMLGALSVGASDEEVEKLRDYLSGIGDSIVCFSDEDLIKVHVHTNHPGDAFEKGLTLGFLSKMNYF